MMIFPWENTAFSERLTEKLSSIESRVNLQFEHLIVEYWRFMKILGVYVCNRLKLMRELFRFFQLRREVSNAFGGKGSSRCS
jgi:hypothetical protein